MVYLRPDGSVGDITVGHARAVLPDRVVDNARLVVRDGLIAEIGPQPAGTSCDLDARGALLLPGLVDVHSDVLMQEMRPRPVASVAPDLAVAAAGTRMRGVGATTVFHGVAFQDRTITGRAIQSPSGPDIYRAVSETHDRQVSHGVLHRVDIRSDASWQVAEKVIRSHAGIPLVSHEDHTPGLGQFTDPDEMVRWLIAEESMTRQEARAHVESLRLRREKAAQTGEAVLSCLGDLASAGAIRLAAHDLVTADEVVQAAERGCAIAEFPTTMVAAQMARDAGMLVVAGAPNIVRGGSHAGNVSAEALVEAGLVDVLASDYMPSSVLLAIRILVGKGVLPMPAAARLATTGPASCAGLVDRGALRQELRADFILVDFGRVWPSVLTFTADSDESLS